MPDSRLDRAGATDADVRALLAGGIGALLGVAGLILAGGVAADVRFQYATSDPIPLVPFSLYAGVGVVALGGAAGYLYQRYRTATPALVSLLLFTLALGQTWWTIRTRDRPTGPREAIPLPLEAVTALEYLLLGWPLLLAGVVLLAGLERHLTRRRPA